MKAVWQKILEKNFFVKTHDSWQVFSQKSYLWEKFLTFSHFKMSRLRSKPSFQLFFKFIARFWVASSSRKNLKDIFVFQISFTAAFKVWRENCKIFWQIAAHNLQKTLIILSPFWCSDPNHCNIIRNSWDFMNFCCLWLRLLLKTPSAELHQFLQCYQPTRTFLKKAK